MSCDSHLNLNKEEEAKEGRKAFNRKTFSCGQQEFNPIGGVETTPQGHCAQGKKALECLFSHLISH